MRCRALPRRRGARSPARAALADCPAAPPVAELAVPDAPRNASPAAAGNQ